MSKSVRIEVSREVLETMLATVCDTRNALPTVFEGEAFEQGQRLQRLMTKLLDVELALESLCPRQD